MTAGTGAAAGGARLRVGISECLLGRPVRHDGGHKHDPFLTGTLGEWVDWVPVCPEVELGLGTPRPSMRLIAAGTGARLVVRQTGEDLTGLYVVLHSDSSPIACVSRPIVRLGDLLSGESRAMPEPFEFTVADVDRTALGLDELDEFLAEFRIEVVSDQGSPELFPSQFALDLDLDVTAGSGPSTFDPRAIAPVRRSVWLPTAPTRGSESSLPPALRGSWRWSPGPAAAVVEESLLWVERTEVLSMSCMISRLWRGVSAESGCGAG